MKGEDGEYLTDKLTNVAVDFIEKNQSKPFFLYLPHYAVHVPIEAKQKLVEKYLAKRRSGNGKGCSSKRLVYIDLVMDTLSPSKMIRLMPR